jgi:hypothetical protein
MLRRRVVLAAPFAVLVSGCAAAGEANPEKIGPRGVDELTIPTPSPNLEDFVATIDNPYLAVEPGRVWTYDVSGSAASRLVVRVQDEASTVAGVRCTTLYSLATASGGAPVWERYLQLAQDLRGNVWTFGENGDRSWGAGQADARAGLFMAATPRVGDGYLEEDAPDVAADRTTVLSLTQTATVPAGEFADVLLLETRAEVGDLDVTRRSYAVGAGLVESLTTLGGTEHAELVSVT